MLILKRLFMLNSYFHEKKILKSEIISSRENLVKTS